MCDPPRSVRPTASQTHILLVGGISNGRCDYVRCVMSGNQCHKYPMQARCCVRATNGNSGTNLLVLTVRTVEIAIPATIRRGGHNWGEVWIDRELPIDKNKPQPSSISPPQEAEPPFPPNVDKFDWREKRPIGRPPLLDLGIFQIALPDAF
jgi:hypothetical protein